MPDAIDAQDLINVLADQRNTAMDQVAKIVAMNAALTRRVAELEAKAAEKAAEQEKP